MNVRDFAKNLLPQGTQLTEDVWRTRHRPIVCAWVLLSPLLLVVSSVNGIPWHHILIDLGVVFGLPAVALALSRSRGVKAVATSVGLMAAAGQLVHATGGLTESHFLFFVLLPLVVLYQDWRPLIAAIALVFVHHAGIGVASPHSVYNHESAYNNPILWALIHATFVAGLVVVLMFYWYWSARERRDLADALDSLRRTQGELLQAQKLESIGQLAAGVAHEINTPIQFVGDNIRFLHEGFSELLALVKHQAEIIDRSRTPDRAPDTQTDSISSGEVEYLADEVPQAITQSLDGIERIAEIVRALKGVAHPGGDSFMPVDINQLVHDTLLVSRNEWKYVAEAENDLDPSLPVIECVPGPLNQVLLNLIVNAAHAIEDRYGTDGELRGRITISSRVDGDQLELRVGDNGVGMPSSVRAKIFDPFFTTKTMGRGTGQGLAISRSVIVGLHGGSIEVESEEGNGATFVIRLPLAQSTVLVS
ncbi:MAG: sensor histidine kinase [Actinomycetota bacterium]